MNKTLKLLIVSDIFIWSGLGLIAPIIAIFINRDIIGGSLKAIGIASAIYLVTHSLLQLLFSHIFSPKDRLWMLKLGTIFIIFTPIGFMLSTNVWHIYLTQVIHGIGAGFAFPSWYSLFASNLEKGKQGFQWSVYSSSVNIGMAITAYIGATIAEDYNFDILFILTGIVALIGFLILFWLEKKMIKKT